MCPSCQIDVVAALVMVSFTLTLYMLFRKGIIRRGTTVRNIVVVFGLLIVTALIVWLMAGSASSSHTHATEFGSGVAGPTTVEFSKEADFQ